MKGSLVVSRMVKGISRLILRRIRYEKERVSALNETNSILSAYIAYLIESKGVVTVSREAIRSSIGRYRALVEASGGDYIIKIVRCGGDAVKNAEGNGDAVKNAVDVDGSANGKNAVEVGEEGNGESLERRLSR